MPSRRQAVVLAPQGEIRGFFRQPALIVPAAFRLANCADTRQAPLAMHSYMLHHSPEMRRTWQEESPFLRRALETYLMPSSRMAQQLHAHRNTTASRALCRMSIFSPLFITGCIAKLATG